MTLTVQTRTQTTRTQYDTAENTSNSVNTRGQNQGRSGRRGRAIRSSSRNQVTRGHLSNPSGRGTGFNYGQRGHRLGGSTSSSHPQEGNPLLLAVERRIREAQVAKNEAQEAKNEGTIAESEGNKGDVVNGDDDQNEDDNKI